MKVDLYTKVMLTVLALALSAVAINYIVASQGDGRYQLVGGTVIDTRSGTLYYTSARYPILTLDARTDTSAL